MLLTTLALTALFSVAIFGSFGVLVDSAVRGWNAFVALRHRAAAADDIVPQLRVIEGIAVNRLPDMRAGHTGRHAIGKHAPRITRRRLSAAA